MNFKEIAMFPSTLAWLELLNWKSLPIDWNPDLSLGTAQRKTSSLEIQLHCSVAHWGWLDCQELGASSLLLPLAWIDFVPVLEILCLHLQTEIALFTA